MQAHGFTLTSQSQQMLTPVRVIGDLHSPRRIAITTSQEIVVTERDRLSFLTMDGQRIRTIDYVETEGHKLELWPRGVTVDEDGAIYVTDLFASKLHKLSSDGRIVKSVGEYDSEKGQFVCLKSIATRNQKLFVCDVVNSRIQIFDTDLQFISSFGGGQHMYPTDLAIDSSGNIYVSLIHGDYIRVVSKDGTLLRTFDRLPGWVIPQGIHIDHDYVYVTHINGISLFHTNGKFITSFELRMRYPQRITEMSLRGITTDRDGLVYVCDARNNCIIVFPRVL